MRQWCVVFSVVVATLAVVSATELQNSDETVAAMDGMIDGRPLHSPLSEAGCAGATSEGVSTSKSNPEIAQAFEAAHAAAQAAGKASKKAEQVIAAAKAKFKGEQKTEAKKKATSISPFEEGSCRVLIFVVIAGKLQSEGKDENSQSDRKSEG